MLMEVFRWQDVEMACMQRSQARDFKDRYAEDMAFGAAPLLDALVRKYPSQSVGESVERLRKAVAVYYGVDPDELLKHWVRHFAPSHLIEAESL